MSFILTGCLILLALCYIGLNLVNDYTLMLATIVKLIALTKSKGIGEKKKSFKYAKEWVEKEKVGSIKERVGKYKLGRRDIRMKKTGFKLLICVKIELNFFFFFFVVVDTTRL